MVRRFQRYYFHLLRLSNGCHDNELRLKLPPFDNSAGSPIYRHNMKNRDGQIVIYTDFPVASTMLERRRRKNGGASGDLMASAYIARVPAESRERRGWDHPPSGVLAWLDDFLYLPGVLYTLILVCRAGRGVSSVRGACHHWRRQAGPARQRARNAGTPGRARFR